MKGEVMDRRQGAGGKARQCVRGAVAAVAMVVVVSGCGSRSGLLREYGGAEDLGIPSAGGSSQAGGVRSASNPEGMASPGTSLGEGVGSEPSGGESRFDTNDATPRVGAGESPLPDRPLSEAGVGGSGEPGSQGLAETTVPSNSSAQESELPPETSCEPEQLGVEAVFERIVEAVQRELEADRPFVRFVVAPKLRSSHCSGRPATAETAFAYNRDGMREQFAVNKMINSASLAPLVQPVQGVEGLPWLLRLDLRDYAWDRAMAVAGTEYSDGWELVAGRASQALQFEGELADQLAEAMQTRVPFVLAGDFVATVAAGDTYYSLIDAPATLDELLASVGVAPLDTLGTNQWMRSAFKTSGVSKQDRGVARYVGGGEPEVPVFWLSLDFGPGSEFTNVYEDPLGGDSDAKQGMYVLPNGLFAYYLADSEGDRLVELPPSIDIDPARNGGVMANSASCHSCHNGGIIPFTDTAREYVEQGQGSSFTEQQVAAVQQVYWPVRAQNETVERDSAPFLDRMEAAGLPRSLPDPVARVTLRFELGRLEQVQVAEELFTTSAALNAQGAAMPPAVRLALASQAIGRNQFSAVYRDALCVLTEGQPLRVAGCAR